ncbi:MAG: LptE family protein [Thermodesulfovibrionales bacterium]
MKAKSKEPRAESKKSIRYMLCSLLITLCLIGCGYSIQNKASLPFHAIQIGKIENVTVEPKLQDMLYKALTDEFLKHGVAVNRDAGYKLGGTINHFELLILSEKSDIATEYEVVIKGNFTLTDPSGKIKELKNTGSPFIVSFSGPGTLNNLIASKELASEKAMRDMAMEIVGIILYQ